MILLVGAAGDPIVSLHHVKQPATEVGPYKIIHDHQTGRTEIWHATDLVLLAGRPGGLSALDAAKALFGLLGARHLHERCTHCTVHARNHLHADLHGPHAAATYTPVGVYRRPHGVSPDLNTQSRVMNSVKHLTVPRTISGVEKKSLAKRAPRRAGELLRQAARSRPDYWRPSFEPSLQHSPKRRGALASSPQDQPQQSPLPDRIVRLTLPNRRPLETQVTATKCEAVHNTGGGDVLREIRNNKPQYLSPKVSLRARSAKALRGLSAPAGPGACLGYVWGRTRDLVPAWADFWAAAGALMRV